MNNFLLGALTMGAAVIGLFFLRFWRTSRDALFLLFAAAFWMLALNWLLLAIAGRDEPHTVLYATRLVAFGLIILGVWIKNRGPRASAPPPAPSARDPGAR